MQKLLPLKYTLAFSLYIMLELPFMLEDFFNRFRLERLLPDTSHIITKLMGFTPSLDDYSASRGFMRYGITSCGLYNIEPIIVVMLSFSVQFLILFSIYKKCNTPDQKGSNLNKKVTKMYYSQKWYAWIELMNFWFLKGIIFGFL